MRHLIFLFSFLSFSSLANSNVQNLWNNLDNKYVSLIQASQFNKALEVAFELNKIDPADTKSLLYIVLASVKSNTKLPTWVMAEPWPNATKQDILNRMLAEQLVNGS